MTDSDLTAAIELAREYANCEIAGSRERGAYNNAIVLARALLAATAEIEQMREDVRLIRLQLHADECERATEMIDELAGRLGLR